MNPPPRQKHLVVQSEQRGVKLAQHARRVLLVLDGVLAIDDVLDHGEVLLGALELGGGLVLAESVLVLVGGVVHDDELVLADGVLVLVGTALVLVESVLARAEIVLVLVEIELVLVEIVLVLGEGELVLAGGVVHDVERALAGGVE